MGRLGASFLIAILLLSGGPSQAAECKLQKIPVELVESRSGSILIKLMLNDKPAVFMLDTGAFWSFIREGAVGDLPQIWSPITAYGAGGNPLNHFVRVPTLQIGPVPLKDMEFMVAPDEMTTDPRVTGLIGGNILRAFDLELDLANNTVNFFLPSGCGARAVYWPNDGYAEIPLEESRTGLIHFMMTLDGKKVKTLIDTGASSTILSLQAANYRFDLVPGGPGVEGSGQTITADGQHQALYRHQFDLLEVGGLQFKHPWLTMARNNLPNNWAELILGTHQLRDLHLYIAYQDQMLYATTTGTQVSSTETGSATRGAMGKTLDPLDMQMLQPMVKEIREDMNGQKYDAALPAANRIIELYPNFARGYLIRAQINSPRGQQQEALSDLDHAIELDPKMADAYRERSRVQHLLGHDDPAKADLDQFVALQPDSALAYEVRAFFKLTLHDDAGAMPDLDKAVELGNKDPSLFLNRGAVFSRRRDFEAAVADFGRAIALKAEDSFGYDLRAQAQSKLGKYDLAIEDMNHAIALGPDKPAYFNNRCWYQALAGHEEAALADCEKALQLDPKSASTLDSRAFVKLKMHHLAEAIADFDAALAIRPEMGSSLYGRGLAKQEMGDAKGAKADMLAAQQLQPNIAAEFGK